LLFESRYVSAHANPSREGSENRPGYIGRRINRLAQAQASVYQLVLDVLRSLLHINDRRIGSAKEFPPDLCLKEIAEIRASHVIANN
jgi:hypothetical protein